MKFGVRECADVVLRAKTAQRIGNKVFYKNEPVCYFDTLKTSTFEGAATTVYAQGGRGNARLMSWDGERTVTFTMEDALISPIGLSILTGAGLIEATSDAPIIQHITETTDNYAYTEATTDGTKTYTGIYVKEKPHLIGKEATIFVMGLDDHGEVVTEPFYFAGGQTAEPAKIGTGENASDNPNAGLYKITPDTGADHNGIAYAATDIATLYQCKSVLVDYYTKKTSGAMQIDITPDKFGGTYYLEASTLWRDQGTGKDLPAEFIIPSCKVQSNFSFTLASSGDPSSFTFTMDAFPDYTRWNHTEKVLAEIQVIGTTDEGVVEYYRGETAHHSKVLDTNKEVVHYTSDEKRFTD